MLCGTPFQIAHLFAFIVEARSRTFTARHNKTAQDTALAIDDLASTLVEDFVARRAFWPRALNTGDHATLSWHGREHAQVLRFAAVDATTLWKGKTYAKDDSGRGKTVRRDSAGLPSALHKVPETRPALLAPQLGKQQNESYSGNGTVASQGAVVPRLRPSSAQPSSAIADTSSTAGIGLAQFGVSSGSDTPLPFVSGIPTGYQKGRTKYVAVLGTVMSGLGKGVFSSSLAKLLKDKGMSVAPIKLEGYMNMDSGTLNPYRHGEVFVLDDGTETDLDLGTYERILGQSLNKQNFATSGQIFSTILERERKGGYLGHDVQMIPHVTGEVKRRLRSLAMQGGPHGGPADVVFVEVGGTAGDYENGFYIEALRQLAYEEGEASVCFVALTYVIEPVILGEQKSKAAQLGLRLLMQSGIQPHLIACRSSKPATRSVIEKLSMFSNVPISRVWSMHNRESIYAIPDMMRATGLDREVLSILDLHRRVDAPAEDRARSVWWDYADAILAPRDHEARVGILGKYASLRDAYASIEKSLEHASTHLSVRLDIRWIDVSDYDPADLSRVLRETDLDAIIVPGGFGERGVEGKIETVRFARENRIPFLGICLGFQMAVIEFARNVAGIDKAHSTEFGPCDQPVISELPEQKLIEGLGGTMRLGGQDVRVLEGTLAHRLFQSTYVRERFRHRFEVEPRYIGDLEAHGIIFSGRHPSSPIMQMLELPVEKHPFFFGAQSHPELTSRPLTPQPIFMGLVAAAARHHNTTMELGGRMRRWLPTTVY